MDKRGWIGVLSLHLARDIDFYLAAVDPNLQKVDIKEGPPPQMSLKYFILAIHLSCPVRSSEPFCFSRSLPQLCHFTDNNGRWNIRSFRQQCELEVNVWVFPIHLLTHVYCLIAYFHHHIRYPTLLSTAPRDKISKGSRF